MFCKIGVLKSFAKFTGNDAWRWRSQLYLKRDSDTDIFLWVLRNVEERVFYRTGTVAASETFILDVWLRSEYFPEDRFFFL